MAKKKSRDNEPINIQERERERKRDEQMRARALQLGGAGKDPRTLGQIKQAEDAAKALRAQRIADRSLSGRTVEYGTRSMLQGLRNWITGGGGSRLLGK
jgi:hypothetical protein